MTTLLDPELDDLATEAVISTGAAESTEPAAAAASSRPMVLRPLVVATLACSAAALMTGGIFGTWSARMIALFGVLLGNGFAWMSVRSRRPLLVQVALLPTALVVGALLIVPTGDDPAKLMSLMAEAIRTGRLLRPPVPFDAGWRPLLILLMAYAGLGAGWLATALRRPQLALAIPLPIVMLTAISQPAEGEFLGAALALVPILVAMGLLFGGDLNRTSELGAAFEVKRLIRAAPLPLLAVVGLGLLSREDVLFPKPVYNPAQKPQRPKAIPLGRVRDRVLFEVEGELTGPWKTGVLDVYDGSSWRLPPYDPGGLKPLPRGDKVPGSRPGDVTVTLRVADLGTTSVVPGVVGPSSFEVVSGAHGAIVYDPRAGIFRQDSGRVPSGLTVRETLPKYPTPEQLAAAPPPRHIDSDLTYVPKPPPAVRELLSVAPQNLWKRLDFLRARLNEVAIAAGAGAPDKAVPPKTVQNLLAGDHKGTPFEIVAAEAMLARWAGVPSRIGYGFDGVLDEGGKHVVRPKLGSNWLEVYFEGIGWVPLISAPKQADSTLDSKDAKFDPTIKPSDDVAVQVYVPYEVKDFHQLYEDVRRIVLQLTPIALAVLALYLALPVAYRFRRRRRRRAWAGDDLRAAIAVEYCELRDAATDLGVGDPDATPLEYLHHVVDDSWHEDLAWLVTRATYGDLRNGGLTAEDLVAARDMCDSMRRRLTQAQPAQSRVLAVVSRASLRQPYSSEVPTVRLLRMPRRGRRISGRRRPVRRVGLPAFAGGISFRWRRS